MRLAHLTLTLSLAQPITAGAQGLPGPLQTAKKTGTAATGTRDGSAKP